VSQDARILLVYKAAAGRSEDPYLGLLPIGLGYLHAVLRQEGFASRLANLSGHSWGEVETVLRRERPALLAISQFTHNRFVCLKLAALAKRINPACFVVLGGPHATPCCRDVLTDSRDVDAVVRGEGEETLAELARCLLSGEIANIGGVRGIAYRQGDEIVLTPPRPPCSELDRLPVPATVFEGAIGVDLRRQLEFVITSRGCPAACTFCASPRFWGAALRFRSPRAVVDEIRYIRDRYGLLYFSLRDDTFTADRDRTLEFCRLMTDERLYVLWNCQSRVPAVDEEMLLGMKRAGCECIQFGVESGSPAVLHTLGKRITPGEVRRAIAATRRAGIHPSIYLITGVPGEGDADVRQTLTLIDEIRPLDGQVSPLAYYPGTRLFAQGVKSGAVAADLFRQGKEEAFFVRTDSFVDHARKRLLASLGKVAAASVFTPDDIRRQKGLLGYCHATNVMAGELLAAAGDLRGAEREYREIVDREPGNPWGWLLLGELYAGRGMPEKAEHAYGRVVALVPRHVPAHASLGDICRLRGDGRNAERHYLRALSLDPSDSHAREGLAALKMRR
jgi:radical SAM superfamily enzyme YgiQ (UPF0313 family)